ncbi:hypothetical protein IV102_35920 [bacterium]|nr:hypothetical protein [bacterium]
METPPWSDPCWSHYKSGYNRRHYDCEGLIRELQQSGPTEGFWDQLWGELHHQGDVGEASYAILPHLVKYLSHFQGALTEWLAFAATVEECRQNLDGQNNPPLPTEIASAYYHALRDLIALTLARSPRQSTEEDVRYLASLIAFTHGQPRLGKAYPDFSAEEAERWLTGYYGEDPDRQTG